MRKSGFSTRYSAFTHRLTWLAHRAKAISAVVRDALLEIFDEAAYSRFLQRHQIASSSRAYAHFLEERDPARKPRCC